MTAGTFQIQAINDIDPEAWDRLFRESGSRNLFYDRTILGAALNAWPEITPDGVLTQVDDAGGLAFLLPFQVRNGIAGKTISMVRVPATDHTEPLVDDRAIQDVATPAITFLFEKFRPDLFIADCITDSFAEALSDLPPENNLVVHQHRSGAILPLPGCADELLESMKSGLRRDVRRSIKRSRNAGIEMNIVDSAESVDESVLVSALRDLTSVHARRFDVDNRPSFFLEPEFQQFHEALCRNVDRSEVEVVFVEGKVGGEVVASSYGLRANGIFIAIMMGFDPEYSHCGPGNLVAFESMRQAIEQGVVEFDLKVGDEPYKKRWTEDDYTACYVHVPLTARGRLTSSSLLARDRLKKRFRSLKAGN